MTETTIITTLGKEKVKILGGECSRFIAKFLGMQHTIWSDMGGIKKVFTGTRAVLEDGTPCLINLTEKPEGYKLDYII